VNGSVRHISLRYVSSLEKASWLGGIMKFSTTSDLDASGFCREINLFDLHRTGETMRQILIVLFALILSGCIQAGEGDPLSWYASQDGLAPRGTSVYVCHGTGCARKERVDFTPRDMQQLKTILASGASSPEQERNAMSRAVQWFEKRVAPQVGSGNDVGGFDFSTVNKPGQMDCIDEATNTTSLLKLAADTGYLIHHRIGRPKARGFFLDGRYPHATAVVIQKTNSQAFAVDSWVRDNGQPPVIMPLKAWYKERPQGLRL
tara:strand:+ start:13094 stop:13876 length:783 start_codon:yes stop_codon:yes gene_type:complete